MILVKKVVLGVAKDSKDKLEKKYSNYYIVHNNRWVAIKPSFNTDYQKLNMLATDYDDFMKKGE